MKIIFLPKAQQELYKTTEFYNEQSKGLGQFSATEVLESIEFISTYPEAWPLITKQTPKFTLKKFPYLILYGIVNNSITISSIAHQHRHPNSYL